jgi:aldehyde dehydrogenase (NAD+)
MCLILEKRLFYINGSWVDPIQGTDCEVIDLTTEEPVAVIALAGQADTDAAVAAAKAALPEWSALPVAERVEYVQKILEAYFALEHDVARAISLEMGAPFGGVRQSGNGREGDVWAIEEFLDVKSVGGWPD